MVFKTWCQVGGGGAQFSKLAYVRELSNIWFQKSLLFLTEIILKTKFVNDFPKISKTWFAGKNWFKIEKPFILFFIELWRKLRIMKVSTYSVPLGLRAGSTQRGRRAELCGWMGGWLGGWWFFTPLDFPHF